MSPKNNNKMTMEVNIMTEIQLITFLKIAKYKSYSKAAFMLSVTQPTVTSRIKSLESSLEFKLFSRKGHEISLTKEGKLFVEYAENILTYMKHSKGIINMTKEPIIKVGFSPGYSYSFMVEVLKTIKMMGNISIQIIEGYDSVRLNEMILASEVDLIFTRNLLTNHPDIFSEYLFDNNLVLVLSRKHDLSEKNDITLNDLHHETIISFRRNTQLWKLIDQQLLGLKNLYRIDVDNNEMLKEAVRNNIGIGITPSLGVDISLDRDLTTKKLEEIDSITNRVYVQFRKNSKINTIAKKIIYSIISHNYAKT